MVRLLLSSGGRVLLIMHQGAVILLRMLLSWGLLLCLASVVQSVGSLLSYGCVVVHFGESVALLFGLALTPRDGGCLVGGDLAPGGIALWEQARLLVLAHDRRVLVRALVVDSCTPTCAKDEAVAFRVVADYSGRGSCLGWVRQEHLLALLND